MRLRRLAGWSAGMFLLLIPFVPLRRIFGEIRGTNFLPRPEDWVLGLVVFGALAWLLALFAAREPPGWARRLRVWWREGRWVPLVLLALLAVLLGLASGGVFHGKPLLVDSVAQLFQARIFADGTVSAPAPPGQPFFLIQQLIVDGGRWYSQYPPGHAALLAVGVVAGAPWAVPLLLSLGTAILLFLFTRMVYGEATARLTLLLLVLTPFFWFMGASFMNHVSSLFFIALTLYLMARWEKVGGAGTLAAMGAALGAAFLSRPLTALAVGVALTPGAIMIARRRGKWMSLLEGAGGFLAIASLYLLYNALTTGDPFLPGYIRLWGSSHGLGFHATPWGGFHTPATGLRNEFTDVALLNVFLFEWPIPALLPVAFFFLLGLGKESWDRRLLLGFLAIPAAYFFYWHRDAYLGPRFLYSGVAFLLPLTARAIPSLLSRLRSVEPRWHTRLVPGNMATPAVWLLALSFGYAVAYSTPQRFRVYATSLPSMRQDIGKLAKTAGISQGIVFVAVSWGNRLISRLRDLGLPASLVERAYRGVDHCDLDNLERRARAEGWPVDKLAREVMRLVRLGMPLEKLNLNQDPTLRLRPGRVLDPACQEEIKYDAGGYTLYTPHLLANDPRLAGPLVVAKDLRDRDGELRRQFPGRPAYLFRPGRFEVLP